MLGKTAGGLYWMFRSLERAENTARLIEAGFRIALTRSNDSEAEWRSVIAISGAQSVYEDRGLGYSSAEVTDFLLRDRDNPGSVLSVIAAARDGARLVRTALTTEVWASVNETWMSLTAELKHPIPDTDLPRVLSIIRQQSALVRGALYGTMLRNDVFDFCRLGTFVERLDSTARIINVKYYSLLPASALVGGRLDNVQWETILRSVSAHRSYRWAVEDDFNAAGIANFLILDRRMPRSLAHCATTIVDRLGYLADEYGCQPASHAMAECLCNQLKNRDIGSIFKEGLHDFIEKIIRGNNALALQIEQDYRFNA